MTMVLSDFCCRSQIAPVPSLYSLHDWPAFKRAKANFLTRRTATNIDEASRMADAFASCGDNFFVVTKTGHECPGQKKAKWGKHDSLGSSCDVLTSSAAARLLEQAAPSRFRTDANLSGARVKPGLPGHRGARSWFPGGLRRAGERARSGGAARNRQCRRRGRRACNRTGRP
jgi:hypothetical protein